MGMRLIDADTKITALLYDEEHEETIRVEMTIADFLDSHTEEGCPGKESPGPVHFNCMRSLPEPPEEADNA